MYQLLSTLPSGRRAGAVIESSVRPHLFLFFISPTGFRTTITSLPCNSDSLVHHVIIYEPQRLHHLGEKSFKKLKNTFVISCNANATKINRGQVAIN